MLVFFSQTSSITPYYLHEAREERMTFSYKILFQILGVKNASTVEVILTFNCGRPNDHRNSPCPYPSLTPSCFGELRSTFWAAFGQFSMLSPPWCKMQALLVHFTCVMVIVFLIFVLRSRISFAPALNGPLSSFLGAHM